MVYVIQVLLSAKKQKIKSEKLVHLVGFIIRTYHDARSPERQNKIQLYSVLQYHHRVVINLCELNCT